jgi:uncharacterized membrane protein YfcA
MEFLNLLLIAVTVLFGAGLTFFSGFGLGTLLLPVFSLFFPLDAAVAATAIVHFANNIFKFGMVYRHIHYSTLFRFGVPAMLAAVAGALLLGYLGKNSENTIVLKYTLFDRPVGLTSIKLGFGCLMIFFALFELTPRLSNWKMSERYMPLGGLLSGFFGGVSGHQGAFRSVFLTKSGLTKEEFIGTSNAIALIIDVTRIAIYAFTIRRTFFYIDGFTSHLAVGMIFAFIGTYFGKKLLTKTTITGIQRVVGVLLIIYGILFLAGVL